MNLHFSLHGIGDNRSLLMPIEKEYNCKDFIQSCKAFYEAEKEIYDTADKIGVGLLMFKDFVPAVRAGEVEPKKTTLSIEELDKILNMLDPNIFKIDLSDFNHTSVTEHSGEMSNEDAQELLKYAQSKGFETKIFSSFGRDRHSGCGMLKSEYLDALEDGETTLRKYKESLELLHYATHKVNNNIK